MQAREIYRSLKRHIGGHLCRLPLLRHIVELDVQRLGFELVCDWEGADERVRHAMKKVDGSYIEDLGHSHENNTSVDGAARVGETE